MTRTRYLLHFAHEHIPFRWPEFLAVATRNGCKFELISSKDHIQTRPYLLIELSDGSTEDRLIKGVQESYLLKNLYELWSQSNTIDDLSKQVEKSPQFQSKIYAGPDQSFRINCESFGTKLSQPTKIEYIQKMKFLETFESRIDLKNPKQTYCIIEMNERFGKIDEPMLKEYFFCRHLANSNRSAIDKFSLKRRTFIANTSMDPQLSLIAANTALVRPNDIVYDPFVGSGSLLVAAAYMGAYILGSDIDWLLIHGKSRPSKKGEIQRKEGECIRANLRQYDIESRYLDVMVSDITRQPFSDSLVIDSIIADPPYGIRECSEKIGGRQRRQPTSSERPQYPSKTSYHVHELLSDLLLLSAKHLKIRGRLVYFLPVTKTDEGFEKSIPTHPCFELISYCDQALTAKNYRLMVVMEKVKQLESSDKVHIPSAIRDTNFRDIYFGPRTQTGNVLSSASKDVIKSGSNM